MSQHSSSLPSRRFSRGLVLPEGLRQGVSLLLVWVLAMLSLPRAIAGELQPQSPINWTKSQGQSHQSPAAAAKAKPRPSLRMRSKPNAMAASQKALALLAQAKTMNASITQNPLDPDGMLARTRPLSTDDVKRLGEAFYTPVVEKRSPRRHDEQPSTETLLARNEMPASNFLPASGGLAAPLAEPSPSVAARDLDLTGLDPWLRPFLPALSAPVKAPVQSSGQIAGLAVFVGYADDVRANPNFPVPWQGAPNTTFIGNGPSFDAGAIRLDNNSSTSVQINDVFVTVPGWTTSDHNDAQGNGIADLWGSFTIAPNSTVILTQTREFNFDTSDFGVRGCGDTLGNGQAPVPTVRITMNGVPTTFNDTGHVLDTGGFDLACRGNESLQWRLIGTSGIENQVGHVTLSPPTSIQPVGVTYTATAQVTDAGNQPTPNVVVNFVVLSGPNAGKTGTGTTDAQGNATFSYSSALLGTDILQASVTNATGGSIQSEQVTTTWTTADPCPTPTQPPDPSQTVLINAGPATGEFNDPLTLAVQLTDANGVPLAGRALSLAFASQTFLATTDSNGIATVNLPAAPAPGSVPLTAAFAGETGFKPAQLSTNIAIDREETSIRYTGGTLLGTAVPQPVSAVLTDPISGLPIANETVTFRVGSVQAQGVTNAQGIATTTLTLGANQTSGPTAIQVSFAGDILYKPSITGTQVTVYLSTSFVVWGGNQGGVHLGQDVNFWGHSWADQVTSGNFTANPSFKGFADPVNQVHVCEAGAGSGGALDDQCWHSKPGNSFPPPLTLPAFIEVIISTAIAKQGSEIFGNIAAAAVCQVDPTPAYAPDPGHPGFCKLVAVVEDGGNVFPQRPSLTATQSQPPTVLPAQTFNVTAQITNNSTVPAVSVTVNESFDGVTPATGTQSFNSILNGAQQTAIFQVTSLAVPVRSGNETSLAYQQRLAATDGRLFTSTGTITFTDAFGQPFLPITVSSFSRLRLPELRVGITGPSCVGPGSKIPYKVTVNNVGTAEADNVSVLLNMPDGTNASATIASIAAGGSVTVTINLVAPVISAKQPGETDDQYRARLAAIDGSDLIAVAKVNWQDQQGNSYGQIEQKIVTTVERVPIVTVTPQGPATILPGQKITLNFSVQNIGGGNSSQVLLQVTNPDGSVVNIPAFALQGGQANAVSSTFTVPGAAKAAGESDAAYQARLAALDNSSLKFTTQLRWFDAASNLYGPTGAGAQTTEILPVLSASLTGPATTFSTNNINYDLRIANIGHADASTFSVVLRLPDGSTVNPFPASPLVAGSAAQISIPFGIPLAQPSGLLTAAAVLNWTDAAANAYGPQSPSAVASNTHLDLPAVSAGPNQSITSPSTTLNGSATDNNLPFGSTLATSWSQISGPAPAAFSNGSSPVTQITFTADGTYVVQLTASVTNTSLPLSSTARATIVVNAPTGGGGGGGGGGTIVNQVLQGQIGQPLVGTVVTGQVPITVASGTTLTSGVLDFWPVSNPANVTVLNSNTTGTGTIGVFDGSTLQNGQYIVRLTSTLSDGTAQASLITLSVIGENKPGRITKTIPDLRVPVAGMTITINRIYDSLERGQVGDFGFGWKLGTNVQVSVDASNNVSFTFNGQRQTFFFAAQPGPFPFTFLETPSYAPSPGLHGTLTSDGCSPFVGAQLTCFPGGSTYQPTTFTYNDPYGRVYVFGADGSMKSIKDLNGNVLTFTPAGISSAGGISVAFARDAQARITQITDLNGKSHTYAYDAAGNLAAVTKPDVTTPVTYTYTADHLLLQQTDPRGNSTSATYFPNGRLQSSTDPLGNVTQYSYDLTTNTTTTTNPDGGVVVQTNDSFGNPISMTDPLGRTSTFTYDANQNMLTMTNALGKTTTFTYDGNGNVTSVTDPLGHTTTKVYDNTGRMTQVTDPLGNLQTLQYDAHGNFLSMSDSIGLLKAQTQDSKGNMTSLTLPNGSTAQFSYDAFGNAVSITDHVGFTGTRQYDSMGRWTASSDSIHGSLIQFQQDAVGNVTQRRDPSGNILHYTYDSDSNRIAETDQNGNSYSFQYDAVNRRTQTTFPDGSSYKRTYNFRGQPLTTTNQSGQTARYTYDLAGQRTQVVIGDGTPDAVTLSFAYDAVGRPKTFTDARGNTSTGSYDDAGQLTSLTDGLGRVTSLSHDAGGRVTSITHPNGTQEQLTYDVRNRPLTNTYADGTKTQYQFDGLTLHAKTDEAGKTTAYTYDGAGQITSVTDALGNKTQYTRDAAGRIVGVTDANGHTTSYQYDVNDRIVKEVHPDGSFEQYTYDANNNLTSVRLTDGNINKFTYDNMDRLTQITYFDGQIVSFTYTAIGKRKTATTSNGTTQYAYDNVDRLISVTQPNGQAITYTYDGANNITAISSPAALIRYSYDAVNRLISVVDPLGGVTTYTYDVAGRLIQRVLPNGVITKQTFDSRDRLLSVSHQLGTAAPFESFQYALGPSGNRLSVLEANASTTNWTYDDVYRLIRETVTQANGTVSSDVSYTYDNVDNRLTMTANGTTTNYQYNVLDQLTAAGTAQNAYDGRGNLVKVTDTKGTTSYTYDAANRLSSVALPVIGPAAAYSYDADGLLVSRASGGAVRRYVWDQLTPFKDVLYETDDAGNLFTAYTLAQGSLVQQIGNGNTSPSYYLQDGLGSVVGLTDPNGAETDRYRFDAFGKETLFTGTTMNAYRYRTQRTDEISSLLYLRARHFNPGVGRFITRDVAPFDLTNPLDLNRYNYAAASPINDYDPTGYQVVIEYGSITSERAQDATIEGYVVGRWVETLISCVFEVLIADMIASPLDNMLVRRKNRPVRNKRDFITVALGWVVKSPGGVGLDVKYGRDSVLLPASAKSEEAKKLLIAKADEFEASTRFPLLGFNVMWRDLPGALRNLIPDWLDIAIPNIPKKDLPDGDKQGNHAERQIINESGAPDKSILESVGASTPVCETCQQALSNALVRCYGPIEHLWYPPQW